MYDNFQSYYYGNHDIDWDRGIYKLSDIKALSIYHVIIHRIHMYFGLYWRHNLKFKEYCFDVTFFFIYQTNKVKWIFFFFFFFFFSHLKYT